MSSRTTNKTGRNATLVGVALLALVIGVFGQTAGHGFIDFDDPHYVIDNAMVQRGLTREGAVWALTTTDYVYWQPLTWLSHMVDQQVYGSTPAGPHVTNVVIHAATTLLVWLAFLELTGAFWRSAAVAALFAIHPLHVEPVAWIAERKELLAGFFWFACLIAYASYARRPAWNRYLGVAACCALGLMSKPVTVTLPFALLLLDCWPLRRFATTKPLTLVLEKMPLVVLAGAASVVTYTGQARAGAMNSLAHVGWFDRIQNAVSSYARYLGDTLWPHALAPLYPYDQAGAAAMFPAAVGLLLAITVVAVWLRSRLPFVLFGWLWFIGVLVPMIGLIQVGEQSRADRFMYVPSVGLFVAIVWSAGFLLQRLPRPALAGTILSGVTIAALTVAAYEQTRYWSNTVTLFRRTVDVTRNNPVALHLLGFGLAKEGRLEEAVPLYRESLSLMPHNPIGHYNLALALDTLHRPDEAAASLAETVRQAPTYAEARFTHGATLMELNRLPEARDEFEAALRLPLPPGYPAQAQFRLGLIAAYQGDLIRARDGFSAALQLQPDFAEARANLDQALARLKAQ